MTSVWTTCRRKHRNYQMRPQGREVRAIRTDQARQTGQAPPTGREDPMVRAKTLERRRYSTTEGRPGVTMVSAGFSCTVQPDRTSIVATLAKERLAMEVAELDHVIVDDRDRADAGSRERRNDRAPDAARAHYRDARGLELLLPDSADLWQDNVPRVAVELVVGEPHCPVEPKPPAPRSVSLSSATSRKFAFRSGAGTSCAIRSPRRTSNGSLPRLARMTFTSPR